MVVGSPAHAGIDPIIGENSAVAVGFPRTRGDRPIPMAVFSEIAEVPPHTRG